MRKHTAIVASLLSLTLSLEAPGQVLTGTASLSAEARAGTNVTRRSGQLGSSIAALASSGVGFCRAEASAKLTGLSVDMSTSTVCTFVGLGSSFASASGSFRIATKAGHQSGLLRVVGTGAIAIGDAPFSIPPRAGTDIPISFGTDGLSFRMRCNASFNSSSGLAVRFVPSTTSAIQAYGPACNAQLQGAWHPQRDAHRFVFRTTRAPSTPWTFLLIGSRQGAIPLPPSGCQLLTDFPILLPIAMDARGESQVNFVAGYIPGLKINVQFMGSERAWQLGAFWRTSNALRIELP